MAVLASIVSRPSIEGQSIENGDYIGGFRALRPAITQYPQFLEMLVSRLSSADHALCANALQLINALMRDTVMLDDEAEWPKFIKRTQDLGVIKAVYILMQSSALHDLAHPLLEFQQLTKILLSRWKSVAVNVQKPEHRRTIKAIHLSSNPPDKEQLMPTQDGQKPKHDPNKWRRLGFLLENPEPDFEGMGFLGMMDLSDYVRKHQDEFHNILAEQEILPLERRCPMARASLTVTAILFEHFEVDKIDEHEARTYLALESRSNYEQVFRPLLLHWSRLHVAGLHAFLHLWKATGAELEDFSKIVELVRILMESVVGNADRTRGIESIEQELANFECKKLRELQMELLDLAYDDAWAPHLRGTKDELQSEVLQFVKEQRIRRLLAGSWFQQTTRADDQPTNNQDRTGSTTTAITEPGSEYRYRYIQLSPDRQRLHWDDFDSPSETQPDLKSLHQTVPLSLVSSVVSNVTATESPARTQEDGTLVERYTTTRITIHGYDPSSPSTGTGVSRKTSTNKHKHARQTSKSSHRTNHREIILLTFQPTNHIIAAEWLDGLLMLLEQQPITAETNKIVRMISDLGLKVRLLNVRGNDEIEMVEGLDGIEAPQVPSREGLDEDYFYEI